MENQEEEKSSDDSDTSKGSDLLNEQLRRRRDLSGQSAQNEFLLRKDADDMEFERKLKEESIRAANQNQFLLNNSMILQSHNDDLERMKQREMRMISANIDTLDYEKRRRNEEFYNQRDVERYEMELSHKLRMSKIESDNKLAIYEKGLQLQQDQSIRNEEAEDRFRADLMRKKEMQLAEITSKEIALKNEVSNEKEKRVLDQYRFDELQRQKQRAFFNNMELWNETSHANREKRNIQKSMQIKRENELDIERRHEINTAEANRVDKMISAKERFNMNELQHNLQMESVKTQAEEDRQSEIRRTLRELDDTANSLKGSRDSQTLFGNSFTKGQSGCFVFIVLDESGSMNGSEVLTGLNNFIQRQKMNGMKTSIMILKFSKKSKIMVSKQSINNVKTLTSIDYSPSGSTSLYDAIIEGVQKCQNNWSNENIYFAIFTDGGDNTSSHSSQQAKNAIQSMVDWTFFYIGVNPDNWSRQMAMDRNNCFDFNSNIPSKNFDKLGELLERSWKILREVHESVMHSVTVSLNP